MYYGLFTTGDVAKLLGTTSATIARLIDAGELKGHTVPMSRNRRINRKDLIAYCRAIGRNDLAGELESDLAKQIVVASRDDSLAEAIASLRDENVSVEISRSTFDLGFLIAGRRQIDVLVIDTNFFPQLGEFRRRLGTAKCAPARVIALMRGSKEPVKSPWLRVKDPIDPAALCERIKRELESV